MVFDMCPGCGKEYDTIDEVFGCKCEPEKIENVFKPINDALSERDTRIATLERKLAALVEAAKEALPQVHYKKALKAAIAAAEEVSCSTSTKPST